MNSRQKRIDEMFAATVRAVESFRVEKDADTVRRSVAAAVLRDVVVFLEGIVNEEKQSRPRKVKS